MVAESLPIRIARESIEALGLRVREGMYTRARYGYFAGRDSERADDLNRMFRDPEVDAIFALRGGWGAARILPLLDWEAIRANPKILLGYSDVTALLLAIHARTGLITFHGPMGISTWTSFPVEHLRSVLFRAEAPTFANPAERGDTLVQTRDRVETIYPGMARGRLLGGNLTVLTGILGSQYLPEWEGAILFLEDVDEGIYRVDRMLTQLALAGVLERISGFVFGKCTNCNPSRGYGSLTMEELFRDHIAPLGIPAWSGAMIGHITEQWTLPVGAEAEIDASRGTIRLLAPAVR
jgi:muramoyltetrapeptide carboxypeptidase